MSINAILYLWERPGLPCVKGKRSAVAVVNDSPVGCQSRDRAARRRLSAKLTEGLCGSLLRFRRYLCEYGNIIRVNPSVTSVRTGDTSPYTGEAPVRCKIGTFFVIAGLDYVLNAATSKVITV